MAEKPSKPQPNLPQLKEDPMVSSAEKTDMEEMKPEYKSMQLAAADKGKIKPVPLASRKSAHGEPDPGPPTAPIALANPTPRVIHPNERAPRGSGLTRFKMRCLNYGPGDQPTRYVLARNESEAREEYLRHGGLRAVVEALTDDAGVFHGPSPRFAIKVLED